MSLTNDTIICSETLVNKMIDKLKYFSNLDGLRGFAAFSVLIFHFFLSPSLTSDISNIQLVQKITEILQHGVTLFFVLSGFVITRILINTKDEHNYFARFYKNRALRIFPLYYFYLIIHFYVFPTLFGNGPNLDFSRQLPIYFYLQNMSWLTGFKVIGPGHFWSLAVEEHFYLVWPLILYFFPRKYMKHLTILLILISVPIKYLFLQNNIDINYNTFSRFDSIMIGCFIAVLEYENKYILPKLNIKRLSYFVVPVLILGFVLYIFQDYVFILKSSLKHLILGLFFGFLIYFLISNTKTVGNKDTFSEILDSVLMQYFGKISYGLYVWHILAISIVSLFNIGIWHINLFLTFLITIILAHFSYFYFEKHFLKLK